MTILDDLNAVYERVNPTIWYVVSDTVPIGKWLRIGPTELFPVEVHYFHPDNWAQVHRELTDAGCHLRDFRGWRPEGAKAPTIINVEATSESQQLADARTANALLRERLQEQERIVAKERERADRAEQEAEYWREENRAVRDAAARTMEDALYLMRPAVILEQERNNLRIVLAAALSRADAAERRLGEARVEIGREWQQVLDWLIEDTQVWLANVAEPNSAFYNGKLSALTFLRTLAMEDATTDTQEHALRSAALSSRHAALLAAAEGVEALEDTVVVGREAFERLKGVV